MLLEASTDTATHTPEPPAPAAAPATPPAADAHKPVIVTAQPEAKADSLKATLAEFGGIDLAKLKELAQAGKAAQEASKSEAERAAQLATEHEKLKAKAATLEDAISARAAVEVGSLSDTQKAAVLAIAGGDAAAQLRAIDALRPTWQAATPVKEAQAASAPAPNAPAPGLNTRVADVKAQAEALKGNPFAHAAFVRAHRNELYPRA